MDIGVKERQKIRQSSGSLTKTKIQLCSYEMYQVEYLDRMLTSVQKTEDAFIDVNNRIIRNINARKDRLNLINSRIQGISGKILALYNQDFFQIVSPAHFPKISTSESASNHPYQSIFYDNKDIMTLDEEIQAGPGENPDLAQQCEMPELSSIKLKKKLYNTRLRNKPEDLQQIVSGATKDITDITKLLLSLNKYHADVMSTMNSQIKQSARQEGVNAIQEGILGQKPKKVSSVAELMLFDSDVNVYEEQNVQLTETAEFNIRGKKQKYFTQKEINEMASRREQILKKQEMLRAERAKLLLEDKPDTMKVAQQIINVRAAVNDMAYIPATQDIEIGLADDLNGTELAGKFDQYEQKRAQQAARRRAMREAGNDPNQSVSIAEQESSNTQVEIKVKEDIAPSVAAKLAYELELQRRAEEEARIQQLIEEQRLADPDTPIEQERDRIHQMQLQRKMQKQQDEANTTREMKDFSKPAISLGTVLAAQVMKEIEKGEKLQTQSTIGPPKMGAPMGRAPTMRPPQGAPPKIAAPKIATPIGSKSAVVSAPSNKLETQVQSNTNIPKAPPINWFYSWIKKEPFGDNIPQVAPTPVAPIEPIAKAKDQGGGSDDSMDLTLIEEIGGSGKVNKIDGGNDFAPPKELSLAEQLLAQSQKLKPVGGAPAGDAQPQAPKTKPASEMTLAEQLLAQSQRLKPVGGAPAGDTSVPVRQKPESEMTLAEQLQAAQLRMKPAGGLQQAPPKPKPESEMTLAEQLQAAQLRMKPAGSSQLQSQSTVVPKSTGGLDLNQMDTIKEVDEESNRDTIKGDLNTAAIQTKPPQIKETPSLAASQRTNVAVSQKMATQKPSNEGRRVSTMDGLKSQLTMRLGAMAAASKGIDKKKKRKNSDSLTESSDSDED